MMEWMKDLIPAILAGAIGYMIGSLRDAHTKLDKLASQIERLHTDLYDKGVLKDTRKW